MYIKVRVVSSASKEKVEKKSNDHYNISVKEKAKMNQANNRIREIIAREFGVTTGAVRIVNGHQSPSKILSVNI